MADQLAPRIRRILHEKPDTSVNFTFAISRGSFHHSLRLGRATLFLNPVHQELVREIRERM